MLDLIRVMSPTADANCDKCNAEITKDVTMVKRKDEKEYAAICGPCLELLQKLFTRKHMH